MKKVTVVVQTHWDREWYFAHQTFIARLLRIMEQVVEQLENDQLASFLFDGQVSAIEDFYAHAEPELAEKVKQLVKSGRIVIGPWYIMADEFLCHGESLVRNLEMGITRAKAHGNCQNVGYLPDTFGHISQMPQILAGFGIDNAVAWRGIDQPNSEISWQASDGTQVLMVFLTQGYYQHPFNTQDWQDTLTQYLDKVSPRSTGAPLLLTQGGDHLLTVENLAQKIEQFNDSQKDYQLSQSNLQDYVDDIRAQKADLTVEKGELRANKQAFVLPDVLSTRVYLKQLNQATEDRLLGQIEPLLAVAPIKRYPANYLDKTWQLLIEQHAHDSICGCSIDEVHQEMEVRYKQLAQRLDGLQTQAQLALGMTNERMTWHRDNGAHSPFADDSRCSLFNPSAKAYSGHAQVTLFLAGEQAQTINVKDAQGKELACTILSATPEIKFTSPIDDFPDTVDGFSYQLAIDTCLEGLEFKALTVTKSDNASTRAQASMIENDHYRIWLSDDNQLCLLNKQTQQTTRAFMRIESELDGGDSYNFSPVSSARYEAQFKRVISGFNDNGHAQLSLEVTLAQPAKLDDERSKGSDEQVLSHGELTLSISPAGSLIDAKLHWHNLAEDQRLRVVMPLGKEIEHSFADSAFDWVKRGKQYFSATQMEGLTEIPVAVNPSNSAIKAGSLGVVHKGLQEFEILKGTQQDSLGVTLLRSIGWLSRRDLVTRGLGAGPDMPTPEGQCIGKHTFEWALDWQDPHTAQLLNAASEYRRPVMLLKGHSEQQTPAFTLANQALQISSLRKVKDTLELRVWNPTEQSQEFELAGKKITRTNLKGERIELNTSVASKGIATFLIE